MNCTAVSGESRRGGEDKMLEDLENQVLAIYQTCVAKNEVGSLNGMLIPWYVVEKYVLIYYHREEGTTLWIYVIILNIKKISEKNISQRGTFFISEILR